MAQASRTFRVFISSTFNDLKAERNVLQERVYPRLKELCTLHGTRFQAIDLRWGVSEEAALDQQTMNICLGEIARCQMTSPRPNFIVLLGDRYGWCPLPPQIPLDEFEQIKASTTNAAEINELSTWYKRDDNAVPPEYILQPRLGELARFKDRDLWDRTESRLRQILLNGIERISLNGKARLKYTASATAQEIYSGALGVENAKEHVFCFFRQIEDLPISENTRDFQNLLSVDGQWIVNQAAQVQVKQLKLELNKALPGNIKEYKAQWDEKNQRPTDTHLDQLCEDVYNCLERVILSEIAKIEQIDPLQREMIAHQAFAEQRARIFVGRGDILDKIEVYLKSNNSNCLAIWGKSGTGKSALMAKAIHKAKVEHPNANLIYRFVSVTPDSSNGHLLLESLCRQISQLYGADETTIPSDYIDLVQEFPSRLALTTPERPLILFIDALNQMSDADDARNLNWLPSELPSNSYFVVSTVPGSCLDVMQNKLPAENIVELGGLSVKDGTSILDKWLDESRRTLQPEQKSHLIAQFMGESNALYLKLAFEEARRWRSYDGLPSGADAIPGLSPDIHGILQDLFWRLSQEANHGALMVSRSLGYLAAARHGLSEDEILDVLSMDEEIGRDFKRRSPLSPEYKRLPVVIWSRLYYDLEPYMTEINADGTTLLSFYHSQLAIAVEEKFLSAEEKQKRHQTLAQYFAGKPTWELESERKPTLRKTSELIYQQAVGHMWSEAFVSLTDFQFLEARCRGASVYDLEADYRLALSAWGGRMDQKQVLDAFEERLRLESHHIHTHHELLFPQMYNHLTWLDKEENGPIHAVCESARSTQKNWLRMIQDPRPAPPPWLFSLQGHTANVNAVVITPDGQRVISASDDKTIKIWDLGSGRFLCSLEGHTDNVNALVCTPDGRQVISGSHDNTIKVWDLKSGRICRTLEGHSKRIFSVTTNGELIVSGSMDNTIKIWDLKSGKLLRSLEGHADSVVAVAISPDGQKIISGSMDNVIMVWDVKSGKLLRSLKGHTETVSAVVLTPDGQQIVSGSLDGSIKVWDLKSGKLLRSLEGQTNLINSLALTSDGKYVVSGCGVLEWDTTIKVWDIASGRLLRSLEGHTAQVNAVALTPDGCKVVSASHDNSVKVWELAGGQMLSSLEGPTGCVTAVALTPDGQQIISATLDNKIRVWDLKSGRMLCPLDGHTDSVYSVTVTSDGRQVISGSADKMIKVWSLESGQLVRSIEGHTGPVSSVGVTTDGRQVVSGSEDKTIKIWDLASGQLLRSIEGHTDKVRALVLTTDGRQVISGSDDHMIRVWDIASGNLLRSLEGHTDRIRSLALTPDGRQVISGSDDHTIKVWDLISGRLLGTIEGHTGWIYTLAVTPDGRHVVSGSGDNSIKIWNLEDGQLLWSFIGHHRSVRTVAITFDGQHVISGSDDLTIKVWDLEKRPSLRSIEGHTKSVSAVTITPDCRQVISGSRDYAIKVWDLKSGLWLRTIEGHENEVCSVELSPDGQQIVSGSGGLMESSTALKQWDLESGRLLRTLVGQRYNIDAIALSSDGKQIISGAGDKTIKIWDSASGRLVRTLEGNTARVLAFALTHDDQKLISGCYDKTIKIWDLNGGKILRSLEGHTGEVRAVAVTKDDRLVISGAGGLMGSDTNIRVWDLERGILLRTLAGHSNRINAVALTPGDRQIVSCSDDKTIKVWNMDDGHAQTLFINDIDINCLALSNDFQWLACGDGGLASGRVWIFEWIH